ncbi:hypothetical protein OUZ56_005774 [Daphnia magna]|uniref:HTH psq-type domain-containing protein n=1 Tax=Daphnia magna TaxID=35525 RepID=A0ABQ9YU00_9CRUS|nr:hypothetical protein OUZ56_005774 [Daphnia magna]
MIPPHTRQRLVHQTPGQSENPNLSPWRSIASMFGIPKTTLSRKILLERRKNVGAIETCCRDHSKMGFPISDLPEVLLKTRILKYASDCNNEGPVKNKEEGQLFS